MSGVTGSFDKMRALQQRLLKASGALNVVAERVAPKFEELTKQTFATQTDPYGVGWKPLKRPDHQPLVKSGKMLRSFGFRPFGPKVKIDIGVFYARYHISTGRGTLPLKGRLPSSWRATIEAETRPAVHALLVEGR